MTSFRAMLPHISAAWEGPPKSELTDDQLFQLIEKEIWKMEKELLLQSSKYQRIALLEDFHTAFPEFSALEKGDRVRIVEVTDDTGERTGSVIARTVVSKSDVRAGIDPIVGLIKG